MHDWGIRHFGVVCFKGLMGNSAGNGVPLLIKPLFFVGLTVCANVAHYGSTPIDACAPVHNCADAPMRPHTGKWCRSPT